MKDDLFYMAFAEPYEFILQARGNQLGKPRSCKSTLVLFRFTYWHF